MPNRFEATVAAVRQRLEQGWPGQRGVAAQKRLSSSTVEQYLMIARRINRDHIPLLAPESVVTAALATWRTTLEQEYRAERVSASTIRIQVAALRTVFAALQVGSAARGNPAAAISSISARRGLPRPMEPAQVELLCRAIDCTCHEGRRHRTMIELLLHSLRREEVAELTTACVQVAFPTHVVVRVFGKGGSERLIPMHPAGSVLVARYLLDEFLADEWRTWLPDFVKAADDRERMLLCLDRALRTGLEAGGFPLFRGPAGAPVSVRWINRKFEHYRDAAQLSKEFGPHTLRHTFGTELLARGEDLRTVQELMGHADIRSTTIYTKVAMSTQAHATQKLPTPALEETWATSL